MNITNDYPIMIFRNDTESGTFYKAGLSKKDVNGNYIKGYKDVKFKNGVELKNRTLINIKKAWLDFYVKDKKTIDSIFISEFEIVANPTTKPTKEQPKVAKEEDDPFKNISIEIDDDELPF